MKRRPSGCRLSTRRNAPHEVAPAARGRDPLRVAEHRTLALVASAGAAGLGAAGLGAYLAAGHQHASAVATCAHTVSVEADACESGKNAVRAWDWVSVGAWAGAAAAGAVAVVSLSFASGTMPGRVKPVERAARVVVGPGSLGVEGTF